jgi:hypothetical protein
MKKWVIVFLIYADFRKNVTDARIDPLPMTEQMKAELNSLFKDILTVPLDARRARMYVIINSIDYMENEDSETEAKTLFYEVGNPNNLDHNEIIYCEVISNRPGDANTPNPGSPIQNPDFLKRLISKISIYENEEVFFCTHDHGSAFGIFRETDPGTVTGEMRRPIQYNLKRYPYLATFWNRALEEDLNFNKIMNGGDKPVLPKILQIGHALFRVKPISNKIGALENLILATQTSLPVRSHGLSLEAHNPLLVFVEDTNAFEIWDSAFHEENLHLTKDIVAILEFTKIREILSNDELADVFNNWLYGKKVAVLLMMNCWMMNLHTMYSFQETVNCLVAPQGNIGTPGYNYKEILKYMFSHKSIFETPEALAIKCVTSSENKRMRRRSIRLRHDHEDVIDKHKIFAVDLQRKKGDKLILIDHLERFEEFINRLLTMERDEDAFLEILNHKDQIQKALQLCTDMRLVCFDFTKEGNIDDNACFMIDIINWLSTICDISIDAFNFPINNRVLSPAVKLKDEIKGAFEDNQLVLVKSKGKRIYSSKTANVGFAPTGYSLFFPNAKSTQQNLIDNVKKDSLLNDYLINWKEFLKAAYPPEVWKPFFNNDNISKIE